MSIFASVAAAMAMTMQPQASEVTVPGPLAPLHGTLLVPANGQIRAAIVIIPGSGPTDRDGNNPFGLVAASYRRLADALAARGVATLRIEKRGLAASGPAIADGNAVNIADYAADAATWAAEAKRKTGLPCVWMLGHSEGGLVAIAARNSADLCGLILVASPGRPIGQAMREQLRGNPANAPFVDQAISAVGQIEAGHHVDTASLHPVVQQLFAPQIQNYWIDLLSHDPAAMLRGYDRPVLVVQGLRDIQVSREDAQALHAALPASQLVLLPTVNHVLKDVVSDDRALNIATYGDASLPIAPSIVETIAGFVEAQRRR